MRQCVSVETDKLTYLLLFHIKHLQKYNLNIVLASSVIFYTSGTIRSNCCYRSLLKY